MAAFAGKKTPGTFGIVTAPLDLKNIGIDNKVLMLVDERLEMVRGMDLKAGESVEYKQVKQGPDKGKISFIARGEKPGAAPASPGPVPPAAELTPEKPKPESRIITGKYIEKKGQQIIVKEEDVNHVYTADLDVMKVLSAADSKVKSGDNVSVMLLKVDGKEVAHKIGPGALGEQFKSGKEILQENLDAKRAETSQTDAALAQINKENAEGDARIKENKEFAESLAKTPQTVPATQLPNEPEKVAQKEAKVAPAPSLAIAETAECPVELKIHLDCGSYSNFDLSVPALPIDQAIARIEADGLKAIAMMHRMMAASNKGY